MRHYAASVGIPSLRSLPFFFGIITCRTSEGRYSDRNGWVTMTKPEGSLNNAALCRLRGYPEFTELAVLLRDHHLPDLRGPVFPGPQLSPDLGQEAAHAPGPALDMGSGHPVDAGRPRALIPPDAHPRFCQEVRVADEVEQVTEPAGRILSRPAVQLSLHTPYLPQHDQLVIRLPGLLIRPLGDGTGIPRRVFGHYSTSLLSFVTDWHTAALPHARGFPALGVLRRLRPARAFGRHRA